MSTKSTITVLPISSPKSEVKGENEYAASLTNQTGPQSGEVSWTVDLLVASVLLPPQCGKDAPVGLPSMRIAGSGMSERAANSHMIARILEAGINEGGKATAEPGFSSAQLLCLVVLHVGDIAALANKMADDLSPGRYANLAPAMYNFQTLCELIDEITAGEEDEVEAMVEDSIFLDAMNNAFAVFFSLKGMYEDEEDD